MYTIGIILFIVVFLSMLALYYIYGYFLEQSNLKRRITSLTNVVYAKTHGSTRKKNKSQEIYEKLKFIETKLKETIFGYTRETAQRFRLRFEQAGLPAQNASIVTLMMNVAMIFLGFIIYLFAAVRFDFLNDQPFLMQVVILLVTIFIAYRIFDYGLDYLIYIRYRRIQNSLAYCVDLLAICTRASFTLDRAFERIAEEVASFNRDICKEFTQVAVELSIIPNRTEALRNLANRIDTPTMHLLVSGLIHAEEQGVSISQTLVMLSQEVIKQKLLEIEAKAARLSVLLTIPLALFCLPAMMLILLGPVIASVMRSNFFGN